jgi:hypothetical protein
MVTAIPGAMIPPSNVPSAMSTHIVAAVPISIYDIVPAVFMVDRLSVDYAVHTQQRRIRVHYADRKRAFMGDAKGSDPEAVESQFIINGIYLRHDTGIGESVDPFRHLLRDIVNKGLYLFPHIILKRGLVRDIAEGFKGDYRVLPVNTHEGAGIADIKTQDLFLS